VALWIGTKKGLFCLTSDGGRASWSLAGPHFLGHLCYHAVQDPRAPETVLLAAKAGHLGPTIFRSDDGGKSFQEAKRPPAFPKQEGGHVFWIEPAGASEPSVWYAGTSPPALFRSEDAGDT
jgi:hypothetical protein